MKNPFMHGHANDLLVNLVTSYIKKNPESMIEVNLGDILETHFGKEAELSSKDLETSDVNNLVTREQLIRTNLGYLRDAIADCLTLTDLIEDPGEYVIAELESPVYLIIPISKIPRVKI